mmetsp:Transcript_10862/g.27885  ORF Transcript_10862/g.27885 Transcript_10862/m.27885 type:complete len:365 (+) Transcript_10862:203-1297(+)
MPTFCEISPWWLVQCPQSHDPRFCEPVLGLVEVLSRLKGLWVELAGLPHDLRELLLIHAPANSKRKESDAGHLGSKLLCPVHCLPGLVRVHPPVRQEEDEVGQLHASNASCRPCRRRRRRGSVAPRRPRRGGGGGNGATGFAQSEGNVRASIHPRHAVGKGIKGLRGDLAQAQLHFDFVAELNDPELGPALGVRVHGGHRFRHECCHRAEILLGDRAGAIDEEGDHDSGHGAGDHRPLPRGGRARGGRHCRWRCRRGCHCGGLLGEGAQAEGGQVVENGLELVFARLNPRRRLLLCHVLGLVELAPPARQLARLRSYRARLAPTLPVECAPALGALIHCEVESPADEGEGAQVLEAQRIEDWAI